MKFLVLIVLLICMAATFVPCCEFDGCQDEITTSHQEKKEQKGTCSPFSTCVTCAGAVVIAKTIQLNSPLVSKDQFAEISIPPVLSSYFSSFWQPPRLS
jgi:hypothetical protein